MAFRAYLQLKVSAVVCSNLSFRGLRKWVWLKTKQEGQTAGFGSMLGTNFLSHSQMARKSPGSQKARVGVSQVEARFDNAERRLGFW